MSDWIEEHKQKRMAQHAEIVRHPNRWPCALLPMKSQPWLCEDGKSMRFGDIHSSNPLVVEVRDDAGGYYGGPIAYESVEELVKVWAVD